MDDIHDIENVSKVFVMEQRINNLQCCKETKNIIGETHSESAEK